MPKVRVMQLTGASEKDEGDPIRIDASQVQLVGRMTQIRRKAGPRGQQEIVSYRKVTEVWIGQSTSGVKHVREHVDFVSAYWLYIVNQIPEEDPREGIIEPPQTAKFLELAALTYQPLTPSTEIKPRVWAWMRRRR